MQRTTVRRILTFAVAGLILAATSILGVVTTAQPAAAASVTCYGDYCSGKDPAATRCSVGSYTVAATHVYWTPYVGSKRYAGYLELRWSPTCQTNWARFTTQSDINYTVSAVQRETGYTMRWDCGPWQSCWTDQIYSPRKCVAAVLDVHWVPAFVRQSTTSTACI